MRPMGRVVFRTVQAARLGKALTLVLAAVLLAAAWRLDAGEEAVPVAAPARPRPLRMHEPVYAVPVAERLVALTFNVDWGTEFVPGLLDVLDARGVRATFFPTGRWAEAEPELVREIARRGHELGNHGYRHDHPKQLNDAALRDHIVRTQRLLRELTGAETRLYAPPYGEVDARIARIAAEAGHWTIMWTLDTIDWQRPQPETIVRRVVPRVQPGAIILMHPTEPTLAALPHILERLLAEGWRFVPVGTLLERAGAFAP
nr:polysaccharide deacetylase [Bacillota bacterium]